MATTGKKFSSAAAVACVWIGGAVLAQFLFLVLGAMLSRLPAEEAAPFWWGLAAPLVVCVGGIGAVWVLRLSSGWPQLPLARMFLEALIASLFALPLLLLRRLEWVTLTANVLAVVFVILFTWRRAGAGSLGTHMFPGATLAPNQNGTK